MTEVAMQQFFPLLAVAAYGVALGIVGLALARREREAKRSHGQQQSLPFEETKRAVAGG
jgi:hypothetical protein